MRRKVGARADGAVAVTAPYAARIGQPARKGFMPQLTIDLLKDAARTFSEIENVHYEPLLDGVDYGKTIGTLSRD